MKRLLIACLWGTMALASPGLAADGKTQEDGKYLNAEGEPTFNIQEDGTVDWFTFSGFRRYHSECHVCHGPDGLGSTYAPGLAESMKRLSYAEFVDVVAAGRENIGSASTSKMPAFGDNKNVICYMDDIYIYLKARAENAIPRGRPAKREKKPQSARAFEAECHAS